MSPNRNSAQVLEKIQKSSFGEFLETIKFSHTIFAFPFALIATILASRSQTITLTQVSWIVVAMVAARTWAMTVNRIVDCQIDKANPRTQDRALPAGRLSMRSMVFAAFISAAALCISAFFLSPIAFYCSIPTLIILGFYSYTKRFTFLCHFWLGLCLGLAPLAVWIALRSEFSIPMLLLSGAICTWVAGFDILYSLQDMRYDRSVKLHSIPARFGSDLSRVIAFGCHLIAGVLFFRFGFHFEIGPFYNAGVATACILLVSQHWIVHKKGLDKINLAFFNLNGWVAFLLFVTAAVDLIDF